MAGNSANRKPPARKRKRYETQASAHLAPLSLLVLENPAPHALKADNNTNIVEDTKVVNYLLKAASLEGSRNNAELKVPLGPSEAAFMKSEEGLMERIKESFKLTDIAVTSLPRGLAMRGEASGVAGATVFAAFVLITRANNVIKTQAYTLRSGNYPLTALLSGSQDDIVKTAERHGLASFDIHRNATAITFWLRADLITLFRFVVAVLELPSSSQVEKASVFNVIGAHNDKALFARHDKNVGLLEGHLANVLKVIKG